VAAFHLALISRLDSDRQFKFSWAIAALSFRGSWPTRLTPIKANGFFSRFFPSDRS
jgi:hypothetical protein